MSLDELSELFNVPFRFWGCPRCPKATIRWDGDNAICNTCGYNRRQWLIDTAGFADRVKQQAEELAGVRDELNRTLAALSRVAADRDRLLREAAEQESDYMNSDSGIKEQSDEVHP